MMEHLSDPRLDSVVLQMRRFMVDVMRKQGVNLSHCEQLADVLIEADVRGHYSHGLNRLDMYVRDCAKKVCKLDGSPTVLKRAGTAWVDGHSLLGPVVGNFCMDLAVKKAKEAGVGWVVARGSNHYGICGWYVMKAMEKGMIAMSFTNTSPIMYPTRSSIPALGTNPMALGASGVDGDSYILDMATTTVAIGKVEISKRRGDKLPSTWGVEKGGRTTIDANAILSGGGLRPLGGDEISGGYKGYGMSSLVEIFCGILGGAHWGPNIRKWMTAKEDADLVGLFDRIFTSRNGVCIRTRIPREAAAVYGHPEEPASCGYLIRTRLSSCFQSSSV
ncbi:unnamed protein product [Heligmosomoides polygyrus]|uniref:Malate/L-lactate dehydrogenase n=1 Tax=Heligmosomoides polygyrus TaxID=6339 RepID=A0A183FF17_HELPZ|nr:unnamed protein product [Heligmosomoides polygyrus]